MIIIIAMAFCSIGVAKPNEKLVRITVYWAKGSGSDHDTRKFKSASGEKLREGWSVAADPSIFPFGTVLNIKGIGTRKVTDTGTAVKEKKASGGKYPVIDLFFEDKNNALEFANNYPKIVKVSCL